MSSRSPCKPERRRRGDNKQLGRLIITGHAKASTDFTGRGRSRSTAAARAAACRTPAARTFPFRGTGVETTAGLRLRGRNWGIRPIKLGAGRRCRGRDERDNCNRAKAEQCTHANPLFKEREMAGARFDGSTSRRPSLLRAAYGTLTAAQHSDGRGAGSALSRRMISSHTRHRASDG
jgi:hypothetical protein